MDREKKTLLSKTVFRLLGSWAIPFVLLLLLCRMVISEMKLLMLPFRLHRKHQNEKYKFTLVVNQYEMYNKQSNPF